MLLVITLLPLGLGLAVTASAAPARVVKQLVNSRDVRAVAEVNGTIWQATTGGLILAPRRGLPRLYTNLHGLPPGRLHALLVRPDQSVWVGGDRGLVLARVSGSRRLRVLRRVSIRGVRALHSRGEDLLIGTWGRGLQRLRGDSLTRIPLGRGRALDTVTSLAAVDHRTLYVGTAGGGVCRVDLDRGRARRISRRRLPSPTVWSLAASRRHRGAVWVATMGGLALVRGRRVIRSKETRTAARLPVRDLRSVLVDDRGLLVGSFGGGLHRIAGSRLARVTGIPRDSRVWHLTLGTDRRPVVATARGVLAARGPGMARLPTLEGPRSNDISTIAHSSGGLWIGTFDAGLSLFRISTSTWRHYGRPDGLVDDRINQIAVQRQKGGETVWIATPRGISRLRLDGRSSWVSFPAGEDLCPGHVNGIHAGGHVVYLASSGGVSAIDTRRPGAPPRCIARAKDLSLRQVTAVTVDREGILWAGGLNGLARRGRDGRWSHFQVATGHLPDNWVTALAPAPGGVWTGTYDGGVALLSGSRSSSQIYKESSGLPCGWVNPNAMVWWAGTLWLGTMEGGVVVRSRGRWRQLTWSVGLPSADVTGVVLAQAGTARPRIWVATRGGVVLLAIDKESS
jgi:ligand-binding sensor domain-containing protein